MMFKIIDDFLSTSYLKDLQNHFLSLQCEWHYNDHLTNDDSYNKIGSFGFTTRLHWNQNFVNSSCGVLAKGLLLFSQARVQEFAQIPHQIVRARADMTMYNPLEYCHEVHTDYPYEHMTAIFYINNSDGNTLLFDRDGKDLIQEVEPIENRLLIFDGLLQHAGHSPSKHKSRVIVNMNFMTSELINELNQGHNRQ